MPVALLLCHELPSRGHSNNNVTPMTTANTRYMFILISLHCCARSSSSGRQNTHLCLHTPLNFLSSSL